MMKRLFGLSVVELEHQAVIVQGPTVGHPRSNWDDMNHGFPGTC